MLLALAERTFITPKLRADLDSTAGEHEERRKHSSDHKKQHTKWENRKKTLMEARVKCRSAADTKANKNMVGSINVYILSTADRVFVDCDGRTRTRFADSVFECKQELQGIADEQVNLRAVLSRRAFRYETLGIDLDGRMFFALSPRVIEEDGRPPAGWASGLLVWGVGVPSSRTDGDEDDMPMESERWSHFGRSQAVKHLIKWIGFRYKKAVEAARPAKNRTPKMNASTPVKSVQKTTASMITHYLKPNPSVKKAPIKVVIPVAPKRVGRPFLPDGTSVLLSKTMSSDDISSLSSDLSTPPETVLNELLASLAPKDYKPSVATLEEEGKLLTRRLGEVCDWLEVLEWRGMGEVQ